MARDWAAVARAIRTRMDELDMTQAELIQRSRLSHMTVRELQLGTAQRRRSPQVLAAASEALGWPADHLQAISEGRNPPDPDADDPVLRELAQLKETVDTVLTRLDAIERQLADDDGQPQGGQSAP